MAAELNKLFVLLLMCVPSYFILNLEGDIASRPSDFSPYSLLVRGKSHMLTDSFRNNFRGSIK